MFISPIFFFSMPWILGMLIAFILGINSNIFFEISNFGIFAFSYLFFIFLFFLLFFRFYSLPSKNLDKILIEGINFFALKNLLILIFISHVIYLICATIFLGGFPLYWIIIGDERTYVDFVIPSISGLFNLTRSFGLVACLLLLMFGNRNNKKYVYLIGAYFLLSSFFIETSRGNGLVMLLHPIGMYLLLRKIYLKQLSYSFLLFISFILFFGLIQVLRYGDFDLELLTNNAEFVGLENPNIFLLFFIPAFLYLSTPIMNMDLNLSNSPDFSIGLNYSLTNILPSALKNFLSLNQDDKYGLLVTDAFNTTSFLTPLILDFGAIGGLLIASLFLILTAWIYIKAKEGAIFYILIWPPLFMSLVLSSFNLFFLSLVVVIYPLFTLFFSRNLLKSSQTKL